MKVLIILLTLVSSQLFAADYLNPSQQDDVITAIDNICGDTWCEGDYDFNFESIECSTATHSCIVKFEVLSIVWDEDYSQPEFTAKFNTKCVLPSIHSISDIIYLPSYDKYNDTILNQDFYEALTDCITEREQEADVYFGNKMDMLYR